MEETIQALVNKLIDMLTLIVPKILGATIILLAGWVIGRVLGSLVTSFVRKTKIDESFKTSAASKALARFGMTFSSFLGAAIKWFVYTLSIISAIDVLGVGVLKEFTSTAISYLPNVIGAIFVFTIGAIIIEIFVSILDEFMKNSKVPLASTASMFTRFFFYFILIIMILSVLKINVEILEALATAIFWGISIGIAIGLGIALGFGLKDYVAKNVERFLESQKTVVEKIEYREKIKSYEDEIKTLKEKIKQQEEIIKKQVGVIDELQKRKETDLKKLSEVEPDLDTRIQQLVKDTGTVVSAYSGYRIEVKDPAKFPWIEVIVTLVSNGFSVEIDKSGDKYIIDAKISGK